MQAHESHGDETTDRSREASPDKHSLRESARETMSPIDARAVDALLALRQTHLGDYDR
jgi:hypothetical protein